MRRIHLGINIIIILNFEYLLSTPHKDSHIDYSNICGSINIIGWSRHLDSDVWENSAITTGKLEIW